MRGRLRTFFIFGILLTFLLSFISAGIFNGFLGKITGKVIAYDSGNWTQWLNRDSPSGTGDWEDLASHRSAHSNLCSSPIGIQCQTTTGLDYSATKEVIICSTAKGLICNASAQPDRICNYNYQVKFKCPSYTNLSCNDNNACTTDFVSNNICTHVLMNCSDNNVCTVDSCNSLSGCVHNFITGCNNTAVCGNGIQDLGEQCDKNDRAPSASCGYFGYSSGILGCKANCTFDFSKCVPANQTCRDNDSGIDYSKKGALEYFSTSTILLREGEMLNVMGRYISIAFISSTGVKLNIDGLIITSTLSEGKSYLYSSTDTITINDIIYNSKENGTSQVQLTFKIKPTTAFSDYCINSAVLNEFYCQGNNTFKNLSYDCRRENKTCSNGACVISPTCKDSDGGVNYYVRGNLIYTYGGISLILNDKSSVSDSCSGDYLNEAYCFVDSYGLAKFGWQGTTCRYGCANGACKKWYFSLNKLA